MTEGHHEAVHAAKVRSMNLLTWIPNQVLMLFCRVCSSTIRQFFDDPRTGEGWQLLGIAYR